MSEKLDGIRAYWDGEEFLSRLGNKFHAPDWFVADLPADTLDGELWVGRKMFQQTTSIVRSGAQSDEWKQVTYVVFDAPEREGRLRGSHRAREKVLKKAEAPHARALEHVACNGIDHLREELARVEALGGEGLMLRQPSSPYEVGRSTTLLKVKTFHDAEARVIGHAPGTGKHKGRLGALICELADGTKFNVGTGFSDAERDAPPAIGAVITFRYQELSDDGVPRFPSYVGERVDVDEAGADREGQLQGARGRKDREGAETETRAEPEPETTLADFKVSPRPRRREQVLGSRGPRRHLLHPLRQARLPGQTRLTELGSATAAKSDAEKRAAQKRREATCDKKA